MIHPPFTWISSPELLTTSGRLSAPRQWVTWRALVPTDNTPTLNSNLLQRCWICLNLHICRQHVGKVEATFQITTFLRSAPYWRVVARRGAVGISQISNFDGRCNHRIALYLFYSGLYTGGLRLLTSAPWRGEVNKLSRMILRASSLGSPTPNSVHSPGIQPKLRGKLYSDG